MVSFSRCEFHGGETKDFQGLWGISISNITIANINIYIYTPGSSRYVKCLPKLLGFCGEFRHKLYPSHISEDPGVYSISILTCLLRDQKFTQVPKIGNSAFPWWMACHFPDLQKSPGGDHPRMKFQW